MVPLTEVKESSAVIPPTSPVKVVVPEVVAVEAIPAVDGFGEQDVSAAGALEGDIRAAAEDHRAGVSLRGGGGDVRIQQDVVRGDRECTARVGKDDRRRGDGHLVPGFDPGDRPGRVHEIESMVIAPALTTTV